MVLQKCWIVRVKPPAKNESQYGKVKLWISKADGALMQAEAYDRGDRFARRFKVLSGQKTSDGLWMLKQMRIEAASSLRRTDFTPTYLEIDKPEDCRALRLRFRQCRIDFRLDPNRLGSPRKWPRKTQGRCAQSRPEISNPSLPFSFVMDSRLPSLASFR
jgi:hypothetical protein